MSGLVDLGPPYLAIVEQILSEHVPDCEVRAFGSRATWTAKDYSDLDLAVVGDGPLERKKIGRLKEAFEESTLPMRVDALDWHGISASFREVIELRYVVIQEAPARASVRPRDEPQMAETPADPDSYSTIGEFSPFAYGKSLPQRQRNSQGDIRVYGSNGIVGYHDVALTSGPTIIIGRKGTVGAVHYSPEPCWPIDTTFYVEGDDPLLHRYRYYALISEHLRDMNSDTAVPGLNRKEVHARRISVPPVAEQRHIAAILGALDDKIGLNRRMSETLDEMARALFRSWFVDFDPVHAKAKGRPSGLPSDLDALFPDSFGPSEVGEIPTGWRLAALDQCVDVLKGLSYKGSGLSAAGIPLHNLNSIYEGGGYKPDGMKFYTGDYRPRHLVEPGDVVVANTEQGHDRLLIGFAAIVPSNHGSEGLFSHHLFRIRARDEAGLNSDYICHLLNSQPMQTVTSGYATGTTVNMLPVDALKIPKAVLPPRRLATRFGSISETLRARGDELHTQSCALVTMRDTLLPRLLSGKLRMRGAERCLTGEVDV